MFTKSGIMVGLGEDRQAVLQVMDDMRSADVDFLTIGQYLQPTPKHHRVARFVTPEEFEGYRRAAVGKGFLMVSATPLTRSSYHAGDDFARLQGGAAGEARRRLRRGLAAFRNGTCGVRGSYALGGHAGRRPAAGGACASTGAATAEIAIPDVSITELAFAGREGREDAAGADRAGRPGGW